MPEQADTIQIMFDVLGRIKSIIQTLYTSNVMHLLCIYRVTCFNYAAHMIHFKSTNKNQE